MARPNFEISADTRLLYQRLIEAGIGNTVTYADLSAAISRPVQGADPNLQSALRRAFREDGMVFDCVRKIGYRRLNDAEIVRSSGNDVSRLRRLTKRKARKLFTADFDKLSNEERIAHNTNASVFGAVAVALSKRSVEAVSKAVSSAGKELPVADTLRLFSPG